MRLRRNARGDASAARDQIEAARAAARELELVALARRADALLEELPSPAGRRGLHAV